jgi:hypothetical protein
MAKKLKDYKQPGLVATRAERLGTVKVMGHDVEIWMADDILATKEVENQMRVDKCYGIALYNDLKVFVTRDVAVPFRQHILLHELTHMIDFFNEADMTEDQVRAMSRGWFEFGETNPDWWEMVNV